MIYIQQNGINKWKVNDFTFIASHMDIRKINMTVKHPSKFIGEDVPDIANFADCYIIYDNERYDIASIKPTGSKDNTSLDYTYELTFKGAEEQLTRRKVRDLALVEVDNYVSQGTNFSVFASLTQFKELIEKNLKYYFGSEWDIVVLSTSTDSVRVDVSNTTLFELLAKTYEYFGLRWKVEGKTITIGYEPEQIEHIFDYGKEGGLVKITRTGQDASIVNRLTGGGGTRNLPQNYFTDRYSDFAPDPNPISDKANIRNLMPKVFRDSVIAGSVPYIDYVEDVDLIALNGVREDALAPNEDIYPSIAGVEVAGVGRIDEIIGSTIPVANKPDDENYSPTFDIWVKDIGFDLADEKYTATQDAKISFTTGALAGYEFTILSKGKRTEGGTVKDKEVFADTTKSDKGVNSAYRITLIKSDEELEAGKYMMPNTSLYPVAGDAFVIYDIEMPHVYVKYAEERLQRWLEAQLEELKVEKPTYAIEPMDSFFAEPIVEYDGKTIQSKLKAGNKIYIQNSKLTDVKEELHINQITIQYGGLLPKYTFTVTDKVQVNGSAVGRLQSQLDAVVSRQLLTEKEIEAILSGFSTKFLSKVKPDTAQQFMQFLRGVLIENGLTVGGLTKLESAYFGDYTHKLEGGVIDSAGNAELESLALRSFLEVPSIRYNELEYIGEEIIIGAGAVLKGVEHLGDDRYRLTLKLEDGQFNPFRPSDLLKGIYNMDEDGNFTGFGTTYVSVSSIDGHEMIVVLADKSDVIGNSNMPPRKFMHLARIGNFIDTDRQSYISLSAKDRAITQYGGVNAFAKKNKQGKNVRAGVVTTQWGRAEGLEFIENFENLPITKDSDVLYTDTLLYNKQIKVDYKGIVIKEYKDRGQWFEGMECQVTETTIDEVWHEAEKFRLIDRPIENDPFTTIEKPTRESEDWMLILSFKEEIDGSRGSVTFFAKPAKYKKGDRWILTEDIQLLNNYYLKGQILEATYATNSDSDWRLMLIEGDEEATEGINLIRNYDFREGLVHWGAIEGSIVELEDELPTEFYTPSINVIGDEYGYEYAITSENDELIIFDE